jgi:hypothetical protein
MVEYVGHGVANPGHCKADSACLHILAVTTWPEGGTACASEWRQRAIDHSNDLTDPYLARRSGKHVVASGPLLAEDNASPAEVAQNRIQEFLRDGVPFGNFDGLQSCPRLQRGETYKRLQAVPSLCSQHLMQIGRWPASPYRRLCYRINRREQVVFSVNGLFPRRLQARPRAHCKAQIQAAQQ